MSNSTSSDPAQEQIERMRDQLQRQLGYLERSASLFDLGYFDEAVRIATGLRILFHDGNRDTATQGSLIKLLGRPAIQLRSTRPTKSIGAGTKAFDGYLHLPGNLRPWEEYLREDNRWLSVADWWNEVIFVANGDIITRRQLAMWASDKDGGAHSDVKLTDGYKAVMQMWRRMPSGPDDGIATVVPHQHLFALRRFALEVLQSPELRALAIGRTIEPARIFSWPEAWSPIMDRARDIANIYVSVKDRAPEDYDDAPVQQALLLLDELRRPFQSLRGGHLVRSERHEEARALFEEILQDHPNDMNALYALGFLCERLNENEIAEKYLRRALSIDPTNPDVLNTLGGIHLKLDRFDQARTFYEGALAANPSHGTARIQMNILNLSQRGYGTDDPAAALLELHDLYRSLAISEGMQEVTDRLHRLAERDPAAALALKQLTAYSNARDTLE